MKAINWKAVFLTASLVLNALNNAGVVPTIASPTPTVAPIGAPAVVPCSE